MLLLFFVVVFFVCFLLFFFVVVVFFFFFWLFVWFVQNSGFIVSNYRKSLILPGHGVNKCERLYWSVCVQSGERVLVDESWGSDTCGVLGDESLLHVVLGNPVTY